MPELQLQNIDQTLYSKSEQKFNFITKPQLPNLQQTVANRILIITTTINTITIYIIMLQLETRDTCKSIILLIVPSF